MHTKGDGKYASRKEYNSRWSERAYKVVGKYRDIMVNTWIRKLEKYYLVHELLLINCE